MLNVTRLRWTYGVLACAGMLLGAIATAAAQNAAPAVSGQKAVPAINGDDRILGKADAPITIFEYASLTCPHCAAFARDTFPKTKEEWIDTGKAKLVFRDFPLDKRALSAATLARCVPPDHFFTFIEMLFRDQPAWGQMPDQDQSMERIRNFAGLSKEQADACLKDDKVTDFVVGERYTASTQYGVDQTPSFFINGEKVVGEQSYPDFAAKLLTAALKQ